MEALFCEGGGIDRGLDDSMSGCVIGASCSCEAAVTVVSLTFDLVFFLRPNLPLPSLVDEESVALICRGVSLDGSLFSDAAADLETFFLRRNGIVNICYG